MAFNVTFYNFSKRENATYRPTGSGETYPCVLKETSSIANPEIILEMGTADAPSWNYAYIAEFNRYYFISDWVWVQNRLWSAALSTDLLATYKDEIGASELYVLRSSAANDGTIIDDYYPAKVNSVFTQVSIPAPFITDDVQRGTFVIGISGENVPTYGSTTFYTMDASMTLALVRALNNDYVTTLNHFETADASLALQKALIDPIQYITSCIWYPIDIGDMPDVGQQGRQINIGGISLPGASGYPIDPSNPLVEFNYSFTLPDHPQIARGQYMNGAYRKLFLEFPPFGAVELDGTIACNYQKIIVNITIDTISGFANIRIGCGNGTTITELLEKYETRAGVPMQLSSVYRDTFNGLGNALRSAAGAIGGLLTGNLFGAGASVFNGISSVNNAAKPRVESVGSNGSFASYAGTFTLYVQFLNVVDDDNPHVGRPLCQIRRVDTIPGYLLIKDAEIDINGFTGESEAVRAYLESGFFYG